MATTNEERMRYVKEYIRSMVAIEEAMEPYKEQRKDLRQSYNDNGWLTKEDMRTAVRAYRLVQQDADIEELMDFYKNLKRKVGS